MEREKYTYQYDIAARILAYLRGELDEENQRRLDQWLSESDSHRALFARVQDEKLQYEDIRKILSYDANRAWEVVKQKVARRRKKRIAVTLQVAASIILVLGISVLLWPEREVQIAPEIAGVPEIHPGRATAKLTIASGATFQLDTLDVNTSVYALVENNGKEAVFLDRKSEDAREEIRYNKIEIPRGGEYKIVLSDGTKVYLNSQTQIRFPENFLGGEVREVFLSGEAFFEVTRDDTRPFIVHCKDYAVKVLGTAFNISAYDDEKDSRTTLASGKVEVEVEDRKIVLKPGQQAIVDDGKVAVKEVDVEVYTTWMHESFRFQSENIEEIMKKLSRWYAVDVVYLNTRVKDFHFTGYLPRYADIADVLELLGLTTNIKFEVKDRTIMVMEK